jgi:hypothetical protein
MRNDVKRSTRMATALQRKMTLRSAVSLAVLMITNELRQRPQYGESRLLHKTKCDIRDE